MTTTLALQEAVNILDNLMTTRNETTCDVCNEKLGSTAYIICLRNPEKEDTVDSPKNSKHKAHTACETCVENRNYITEQGVCKVCVRQMAPRSRSEVRCQIKNAGIPVYPPMLNTTANKMLKGFDNAEREISSFHDREDDSRIQEGASRRAEAVEESRRHRVEKAEQEAEALKAIEARQAAEEAKRKAEADAEDARKAAEDAKRQAAEEAKEAKRQAEADAEEVREAAKEAKRKAAEEAAARLARIEEEDNARREKQEEEDRQRASAATATGTHSADARKRVQNNARVQDRVAKAAKTRERKKDALVAVAAERDSLKLENLNLKHKLEAVIALAKHKLFDNNIDPESFGEEVNSYMIQWDAEEEEEVIEGGEDE